MRIGEIQITPLTDGRIAMQPTEAYPGTTPEDWQPHQRWLNHDGMLEIPIGCFLVRTAGRVVLVDAGLGTLETPGFVGGRLMDELAGAGTTADEVTDVVFTHLHFDHVGWATQQGRVMFPNADYRCHTADWEHFVGADGSGQAGRKLTPVGD